MSDRISALYQAMLRELRGQLSDADRLACRISKLLLDLAAEESPSDGRIRELRELDRRHRGLLADTAADLSRIYPGRIELVPPSAGFLEHLERRIGQSEELARIIARLQKENGSAGASTSSSFRCFFR